MDRLLKSKRIENLIMLTGMDHHWATITVLVLLACNLAFVIHMRTRAKVLSVRPGTGGEGVVSGLAMFFFWILSLALIPCLVMAAKLNSAHTPTMLGNVWHPFPGLVVAEWLFFFILVRQWIEIKPDAGGKPGSGEAEEH